MTYFTKDSYSGTLGRTMRPTCKVRHEVRRRPVPVARCTVERIWLITCVSIVGSMTACGGEEPCASEPVQSTPAIADKWDAIRDAVVQNAAVEGIYGAAAAAGSAPASAPRTMVTIRHEVQWDEGTSKRVRFPSGGCQVMWPSRMSVRTEDGLLDESFDATTFVLLLDTSRAFEPRPPPPRVDVVRAGARLPYADVRGAYPRTVELNGSETRVRAVNVSLYYQVAPREGWSALVDPVVGAPDTVDGDDAGIVASTEGPPTLYFSE